MTENIIAIVAQIKAQTGKEEALKTELLQLVAETRQEAGCISYTLHQSPKDPTLFVMYENWASKEAIKAHSSTAHFTAFVAKMPHLCEGQLQPIFLTKLTE
ncbi:MAG: antibiotic biosynthesis monooxygenase [Microscillaceae bacterium]|nr:antibiotic biosynthesis monooxygenase [Microscillaceae bacterium]